MILMIFLWSCQSYVQGVRNSQNNLNNNKINFVLTNIVMTHKYDNDRCIRNKKKCSSMSYLSACFVTMSVIINGIDLICELSVMNCCSLFVLCPLCSYVVIYWWLLELTNKRRQSKPLRCHAALLPAAGIQPARVYVNSLSVVQRFWWIIG